MQERSEGPLHPCHVPRKQVKRVVCTAALHLTLDSTAHPDYLYVSEMRDKNCIGCSAASQDRKELAQSYAVTKRLCSL